jgi:hypothetical protein
MGVGGQRHAPVALPPGKTRYPLYRRLGGSQGRSGRLRKITPPPWFHQRTVQPIASPSTDCAIRGLSDLTVNINTLLNFFNFCDSLQICLPPPPHGYLNATYQFSVFLGGRGGGGGVPVFATILQVCYNSVGHKARFGLSCFQYLRSYRCWHAYDCNMTDRRSAPEF